MKAQVGGGPPLNLALVFMVGSLALNHLPQLAPPYQALAPFAGLAWALGCGGLIAFRLRRWARRHLSEPSGLRWPG